MTLADQPRIVADFYTGVDGPTVLMEASSPDAIRMLTDLMRRVADSGIGVDVQLADTLLRTTSSVRSFVLRRRPGNRPRSLTRDGSRFAWEQSADEWRDTAEVVAALLDGPGHQYLGGATGDDAVIELSVGEGHGLAATEPSL